MVYRIISFLINIFSYVFIFTKMKYDFVIIQKFGTEMSLNSKLLQLELANYRVKLVMSPNNRLLAIFRDIYYTKKSRIVILDSFSLGISNTRAFKRKTIIQIWHALGAIKKFGFQSLDTENGRSRKMAEQLCMHRNYTFVVCNGTGTFQSFQEAFQSEVLLLKLPLVKYYQNLHLENTVHTKPKILYLPTYRRNSVQGVRQLAKVINQDHYDFIVKPHPHDVKNFNNLGLSISLECTDMLLRDCDVLITDYSAACFEAALLNKPVIFYWWDHESYQEQRGLNFTADDLHNVCYSADEVIEAFSSLKCSSYLNDQYLNAETTFVAYLQELLVKEKSTKS